NRCQLVAAAHRHTLRPAVLGTTPFAYSHRCIVGVSAIPLVASRKTASLVADRNRDKQLAAAHVQPQQSCGSDGPGSATSDHGLAASDGDGPVAGRISDPPVGLAMAFYDRRR